MSKLHCPECGRYVSQALAQEYGELQDPNGYNPFYRWHVMGTCSKHGRVEIQDHDGEDACDCWSVNVWDAWFAEVAA